jgi:peptide/nickel transport system permease protein
VEGGMSTATSVGAFWSEFSESRVAVAALGVVVAIVLAAALAPLFTPQDPYDIANLSLSDARRPPGHIGSEGYTHVLGTDAQGRDLFSAILYGLRISLQMGLLAGGIALFVGASLGILAAYAGGRIETLIMRVVDLQLSFPAILLALVLAALLGQGKTPLVTALVAAQYAYFARTAYGAASAERRKDYVEAAAATPLSGRRIVFRHLLPNSLPPLIVVATVQIANAISLEATLSFLGLGLPPTEPSLGMLIANGFQYMMSGRYWISVYPGIALIVLIVAINLVGDQIRDQLNPRLKR